MDRIHKLEQLAKTADAYVVFREIEAGDDPIGEYETLSGRYYSEHKDVPRMLIFARAGIRFGLQQAVSVDNDKLADKLRSRAKTLAFNTSANAWPGWEDDGVVITKSDLVHGLDLARLNLRLAEELHKDDKARCNAHWLVGAHRLAVGEFDAAHADFLKAKRAAESAKLPDYAGMADGYGTLARMLADPTDKTIPGQLQQIVVSLNGLKEGEGKFFAAQIEKVAKFFAGSKP